MKINLISDNHGFYPPIPKADFTIFCGDFHLGRHKYRENRVVFDNLAENEQFQQSTLPWLNSAKYWIATPGNHDPVLKSYEHDQIITNGYCDTPIGRVYLDPSTLLIDWPFGKTEDELFEQYKNIHDVDILVTHQPPYGILDRAVSGESCGSHALLDLVERLKPRIHVFGHIHEGFGYVAKKLSTKHETLFVNCSITTEKYQLRRHFPQLQDRYELSLCEF